MVKSHTYIAIPPGTTIKEQLQDRGLTQKEFAERMGYTEKHISQLINGKVELTPDTACRLESVLGVPAQFWANLESRYREKIIKANEENSLYNEVHFCKNFPYSEISKIGWVPKTSNNFERVYAMRKFFEVARLEALKNDNLLPVGIACRQLSETDSKDYHLAVWAQKAKLESRNVQTNPIDVNRLIEILPHIRQMTVEPPEVFCEELRHLLSECGIAIIFLPHIGGSFLHGATFIYGKKIVLGVTVRGKYADVFWFSLFHEIGHIILGHINQGCMDDNIENEADNFSTETLIPIEHFNKLTKIKTILKRDIIDFARHEGIAPGIVLGRLQKYGYVEYSMFNDLKKKYQLV